MAGVRARSPRRSAPKESRPVAVGNAGPKPARKRGSEPRRFLVLSGPNLNRLGVREPGIYGKLSLDQIHALLASKAEELGIAVECRQSNHEGTLLDWIGDCQSSGFAGILINPAAYTHSSYALYDALLCAGVPAVEVHLSNPATRDDFRHKSLTAPACVGSIAGFGPGSYVLGLQALASVEASRRRRK